MPEIHRHALGAQSEAVLCTERSGFVLGVRDVLSIAWLLLVQWPKGLYLHTRLVLAACLAVLVA